MSDEWGRKFVGELKPDDITRYGQVLKVTPGLIIYTIAFIGDKGVKFNMTWSPYASIEVKETK